MGNALCQHQVEDLFCLVVTCGNISHKEREVLVIVDPISTGAVLSAHSVARGLNVIAVWSESVPPELLNFVSKGLSYSFIGAVQHQAGEIQTTAKAVGQLIGHATLRGVIVGCETGVLLGDELSEMLKQRGNGTALSPLRRNKWLQTEAVRKTGANACTQSLVTSMAEVNSVLQSWPPAYTFKAVVKPCSGAGSDGVTICNSKQEVRDAFRMLEGTKNVLGLTTYEVLVQEYLVGDEYVVDTVSLDGEHKVVALWKYDKRIFNGSPVVYYGMRFLAIDDEPALREMVRYTLGTLDTLGIKNGCMHSEIKLEPRGPVLIEVNCRIHGGEGTWAPLAEACCGYSAVSALLDAWLDPASFYRLPSVPGELPFVAHAMEAKMRSSVEGTLARIDSAKLGRIRKLSSYRSEMIAVELGRPIKKTIDAVSACGNVNLVNTDAAQLEADYAEFHAIVESGLFTVEATPKPTAVPSPKTLTSFMAQSPPTSPTLLAFKSFTPSPTATRFKLDVSEDPAARPAAPTRMGVGGNGRGPRKPTNSIS